MKKFTRVLCLTLVAVMLCGVLASCGGPAKDPADAKAALKDNGYTVTAMDSSLISTMASVLGFKGLEAVVNGEKDGEVVSIYYFEDADAAEAAYEKVEKLYQEAVDELAEEGVETELIFKKSGAMVYMGTKQAIKDAK